MDREEDKSKGAQNIAGNTSYFLTGGHVKWPHSRSESVHL